MLSANLEVTLQLKSKIFVMKTNLICGLRAILRYVMIIVALFLIEVVIDITIGREMDQYLSTPYFTVAMAGLVITFVCGYIYPFFLTKTIRSFNADYPDVTQRYVKEICQAKVKCRYCSILACLCFGYSFFYDYDEYRLIVNALMSAAVIFLFQYLKYRKQSNIRE